jgi:bacillithiol synthase
LVVADTLESPASVANDTLNLALNSALANQDWAAFSPNVVLRPLYQETILPNLAYIGGWAEVAYWLQLKTVFAHYQTFLPVVLPRASAQIVRASALPALDALGLSVTEVLLPRHKLRKLLVERHWSAGSLAPHLDALQAAVADLAGVVEQLDAGQGRNVRGLGKKLDAFGRQLNLKLEKALARQHPEWLAPALALQQQIQPHGQVQERMLNWLAFGAGDPAAFADWLFAALDPTCHHLQPLVWPDV